MAVLSTTLDYLFIMAPRTGCTAVGNLLCKRVEGRWLPAQDLLDQRGHVMVDRKHASLGTLLDHGLLDRQDLPRLFKFSTVRNPFDSLASLYVKKRTSYQPLLADPNSFVHQKPGFADDMRFVMEHSFPEWVQRQYGGPRRLVKKDSLHGPFTEGMDYIMRFETLQSDFDEVMRRVGRKPRKIPHRNPTEARDSDYRHYYDRRSRATVERVFKAELQRFDYEF